jgi:hypothetical protein
LSLALLLPAALAATSSWLDVLPAPPEGDDPRCVPAPRDVEVPAFCFEADAAYERIFVGGEVGDGVVMPVVGILSALDAGVRRVRLAPDRAAVDAELAAALGSLDRMTEPGRNHIELMLAERGEARLLAAFAELPGPTGPRVAEALLRPRRSPADIERTLVAACEADLDAFLEIEPAARLRPVWGGWHLARVSPGQRLPSLVELDDLQARAADRCEARVSAALDGGPLPPLAQAAWPHRASTRVLSEYVEGGDADAVRARAEVLAAMDRRRRALRR